MSAAGSDGPVSFLADHVGLPVDLNEEDLPNPANEKERWRFVSHLTTEDQGVAVSVAISFERQKVDRVGERRTHVVRWGLCSRVRGIYEFGIDLDPAEWVQPFLRGSDGSTARPLAELLVAQRLPAPERRMLGRPWVGQRGLELHYGGSLLARERDGSYRVAVGVLRGDRGIDLHIVPAAPPVRWIPGGAWDRDADILCIVPRCRVEGWLWLGQRERHVIGVGHFERAYSRAYHPGVPLGRAGADRFACQLSVRLADGTSIDVRTTRQDPGGSSSAWRAAALMIPVDGVATSHDQVSVAPQGTWQSTRSYLEYPSCIALRIPADDVDLTIDAALLNQEQLAVVSGAPSWSGLMGVKGRVKGRAVSGMAWMDWSGAQHRDVGCLFSAVARHARTSVASLLAKPDSAKSLRDLVGCEDRESALPGVDEEVLSLALLEPLREMVARGGKSWRSFALLASIDAVGGNSQTFAAWSALPELIHAGSLIVDDVEDQSSLRRGRPTCHQVFGEPIAINAGTAAYFLAELALRRCPLPPGSATRIHRLYFGAMRAGHAGQALDLANLHEATRVAIEKGAFDELEQRVHAINRLKTAVPGGAFSRMGAIAGGGTPDQTDALGVYFETVALAFQIVDDVLNLRGFKGDLKDRGEDIRMGKVTLPVVKALALLGPRERGRLWDMVSARSSDRRSTDEATLLMEGCGALERCMDEARGLVETAWSALDPALPDSLTKLNIRAFGLYAIERQF